MTRSQAALQNTDDLAPAESRRHAARVVAAREEVDRVPLVVAGVGWLIGLGSMICFGLAKPEQKSMFDRMMTSSRPVVEPWDPTMLRAALGLNLLALLVGIVAVVLNLGRPGKGQDQVLPGLLIALCVMGLLFIVPQL